MADLWVFGYGSLMWRPGFAYDDVRPAMLTGYRRCFCIYSVHHRGCHARPGLVLGLDRGGVCHGLAFRVTPAKAQATLAYLRAREQVNGVYREAMLPVRLDGGSMVTCLTYLAERAHPSFAGSLPIATQAILIRSAHGLSGPNLDYLINTLAHLVLLGIRERELERVLALAGPLFARGPGGEQRLARTHGLVRARQGDAVAAPRMAQAARRRFLHRQRVKGELYQR